MVEENRVLVEVKLGAVTVAVSVTDEPRRHRTPYLADVRVELVAAEMLGRALGNVAGSVLPDMPVLAGAASAAADAFAHAAADLLAGAAGAGEEG